MALKRPTGEALAAALATATGHIFRDFTLMQRALTHSSARGKTYDNERLEFLGDRVLGLVVTEMLFTAYPDATQGELAVRLSALVSGATCAEIAEQIGLVPLIHADSGVRQAKAKARNVRADAIEALIAAIYLDAGLEAARSFILRYWEPLAQAVVKVPRDPKTELQEWAHQAAQAAPAYQIEGRDGPDHDPLFTVSVAVSGFEPAIGRGRSKREAEQSAAAVMLRREGVWEDEGIET
jgi:ribonuclease III